MNRPDWDSIYMEMCKILAKRSTCLRLQTSSIIVKNNVVVSVGYNGVPTKQEHCCDFWNRINPYETIDELLESEYFYNKHHEWSVIHELHGEMNAILFAGKHGISLENATLYTLYSPCIQCAKSILTAGITKVYYQYLYKRNTDGIDFLILNKIPIFQFNPSNIK